VADFALRYTDQNAADHTALRRAASEGLITLAPGV
jgi:hypothetical protein